MRRRVIDRLDDVQDTRDTGVFFCFRFLHVKENEASTYKKTPWIGRTSPGPPPEVEDLNQSQCLPEGSSFLTHRAGQDLPPAINGATPRAIMNLH